MHKTILGATVLLLVQLALAVALYISGSGQGRVSPATPLFDFAPDEVTALEIAGPAGERLTVRKAEAGWILPEAYEAPASAEQVSSLLARLAELKQGVAVATSEEAARRFKVADNGFERHVLVKKGEEVVGDFYVGSSPAFRQVHVRRAGAPEIVTVALSTFELETAADKWLDRNLFQLKKEEMESLVFPGFTLQQKDGNWQLADLEQGRETAREAAEELAGGVGGLMIQDVLNPEEAGALFAGEPALAFTVNLKDGKKLEYHFAKPEGADYYVLKRSDRQLYTKVHKIQVENLQKYSRQKLTRQEGEQGAAATGPEQPQPPEQGQAPAPPSP